MIIFNKDIPYGTKSSFILEGPRYADNAATQIPVMVVNGSCDGKVLWLAGAVHGHEVAASRAMYELYKSLDPQELHGTVIFTPIMNTSAYVQSCMKSPLDNFTDMDSIFPGDSCGTFCERIAALIYPEIRKTADALISFHALTSYAEGAPYTICKTNCSKDGVAESSKELALAYGNRFNCFVQGSSETPFTCGSLNECCQNDGIPAFIAEAGRGGQTTAEASEKCIDGITRVMGHLGIIKTPKAIPTMRYIITKREFIHSDAAGFMVLTRSCSEISAAGTELAQIHYFGESAYSVKCSCDSIVLLSTVKPAVSEGEMIFLIGTEFHSILS